MTTQAIDMRVPAGDLHAHALDYVSQNQLPVSGVVVFFRGKICGWMRDLACDRGENGRLTHRPGCVAIAILLPLQAWNSVGGDYAGGAKEWLSVPL